MVAKFYTLNLFADISLETWVERAKNGAFTELVKHSDDLRILIPENEAQITSDGKYLMFDNNSRKVPNLFGTITLPIECFYLHEYNSDYTDRYEIDEKSDISLDELVFMDSVGTDFNILMNVEYGFPADIGLWNYNKKGRYNNNYTLMILKTPEGYFLEPVFDGLLIRRDNYKLIKN